MHNEVMNVLPFERSYWVLPNKLLAGNVPTSYDDEERKLKMTGIISVGIDVIINLQEQDETNHYGDYFYDYAKDLRHYGISTLRFPIVDLGIPSEEQMIKILNLIDKSLTEDKKVYVHCWGGVGRTGTVIGCFLLRHGYASNDNVIDYIAYLKRTTPIYDRPSPETDAQIRFVRGWKKGK